jgi:hypothetical protein
MVVVIVRLHWSGTEIILSYQGFYAGDVDDSVNSLGATAVAGFEGAYFDLSRNLAPNLMKSWFVRYRSVRETEEETYFARTKGIGIMTSAMKPSNVEAHCGFNLSYICVANNGKAAPARLRQTVLEARADAATKVYASIM